MAPVGRWLRSVRPERSHLRADIVAGLPRAIAGVPDGMAAAVLVGVNPVQGLYAGFAGPIAGGLSSHTRLMVITTTSAAALAAGSALQGVAPAQRPAAVALLVILVGVVLIAAGIARLGRYTRFVSYSVMIGFLTGIAINIVCGQIADLTGAPAQGAFPLAKAIDVLSHPGLINLASLLTGLGALAILTLLARTRLAVLSSLFALVIPTVVVVLVGAESVARVGDKGDIPRGIPLPHLPDFRLFSLSLVTGAVAIAAIVLVQGVGVAEAAPNPGDARPNPNQDIIAQGVGNLASGFFRGIPVGGSVGQTALNVSVGARTRWAVIWSGLWLLVILAVFSGLVAKIAVPTLGAILIFAAIGSLQLGELTSIMRTGRGSQIAVVTTFAATLFLPVAAAVGIGVALSGRVRPGPLPAAGNAPGGTPSRAPSYSTTTDHLCLQVLVLAQRYALSAAADVSRSCSSCASSAETSPISTRSSGLMKPSLRRKPPARAIASRSGTAQWCSSKMRAAAESFGMSSKMSQPSSSVNTCTPPSAATSSAPAIAPASIPSSPSMPRPIKAPILVPISIASASVRLLRCSTSSSPSASL